MFTVERVRVVLSEDGTLEAIVGLTVKMQETGRVALLVGESREGARWIPASEVLFDF